MARPNRGPRLELNTRGMWEVRWSEAGRSQRVSTRTADRAEATRFLAGFILERDRQREPGTLTVGDVLDTYLREHVEDGPVVDKVRQRVIAGNLRQHFDGLAPDQVTVAALKHYAKLRSTGAVGNGRGRSPSTIRRELNMLKAAFSYCAVTKVIERADIPYIPLPQGAPPKELWLDERESEQFLAAADEHGSARGRLFVHIALGTASRRKAIETLTWDQVDFKAKMIHFNPQGRIQSKKRRVPVPIDDRLLTVLGAIPEAERSGYVLEHAGSITRAVEVICRAAAKRTGNKKFLDVTPHTLRHTWATQAARAGVELYKIAGVLGDTLATVTKNYLHHCPEHLRDAVNYRRAA